MDNKPVILSGIQSSGQLTLGNYLGALKNWVTLQEEYRCAYMIADLHAITVRQEPAALRRNTMEVLKLLLACGIDTGESLIFLQSQVSAHAELAWILNCYTYMGELSRMTQFKDKSKKQGENISAGLFTYPILMAADILLYQADLVPVGSDQKQHLELARNIAERFNGIYGEVFKVPEPYIPKVGARIMSLQEPTQKMSKSDPNPGGFIAMLDKPDDIVRKIKRAVTDSDGEIVYRDGKDGINNLINIYCSATGNTVQEVEKEFEGKGYGAFKEAVAEAIIACLAPIQARYDELSRDKAHLESIYKESAEKASLVAQRTLKKVYKKIGFI